MGVKEAYRFDHKSLHRRRFMFKLSSQYMKGKGDSHIYLFEYFMTLDLIPHKLSGNVAVVLQTPKKVSKKCQRVTHLKHISFVFNRSNVGIFYKGHGFAYALCVCKNLTGFCAEEACPFVQPFGG